ncbi:MAG TPA: thioredoxin fold domain-containing protein [Opitutaceae bacterium]|nr:thioredoxin fold domain-containing protein [Opitutaceae bacterium]
MRLLLRSLLFLTAFSGLRAAEPAPKTPTVEQQVSEAIKSTGVTVVHFWAPWCPNCASEMSHNAWSKFIAANPTTNFIFVTIWSDEDGHAVLAKNGIGPQKNFHLYLHENPSRIDGEKMMTFWGLPVTWTPTTWIFRNGRLRYAINYGEIRFPILQQLVTDTTGNWDK